ncbi:G2/mitotic-specific cyclin-B3 [Arapaima gigas]
MPFPRGKKPTAGVSKLSGRAPGMENQMEILNNKRSPSSPQGAPKKRSAFVDITNANKTAVSNATKKTAVKKTQKSSVAAVKTESSTKKCNSVTSAGAPEKEEKVGRSPVEKPVESPNKEPSQIQHASYSGPVNNCLSEKVSSLLGVFPLMRPETIP